MTLSASVLTCSNAGFINLAKGQNNSFTSTAWSCENYTNKYWRIGIILPFLELHCCLKQEIQTCQDIQVLVKSLLSRFSVGTYPIYGTQPTQLTHCFGEDESCKSLNFKLSSNMSKLSSCVPHPSTPAQKVYPCAVCFKIL